MATTQRVIGYIDGFNLYYGLRKRGWTQFYWIDPYRLVEALIVPGESLEAVKYFTARVRDDPDKKSRQSAFLDAIRCQSSAETIMGKYSRRPKTCRSCGATWMDYEEKMTDCAIS